MTTVTRKLLLVICEARLERNLLRDLERLGAHGYTVSEARGKGSRGVRGAGWDADANIRVEVICDAPTAERLLEHLMQTYYAHYAMVACVQDVQVLRPEKF